MVFPPSLIFSFLRKYIIFLGIYHIGRADISYLRSEYIILYTSSTASGPPSPSGEGFFILFSLTRKYIILLWSISYRQRRYIIPRFLGISFPMVSLPYTLPKRHSSSLWFQVPQAPALRMRCRNCLRFLYMNL